MATPNLSELITTTLRSRTGKLADNVTTNNALLNRLKERGRVKPFSGGRTIVQELNYAENGTFMYYSGYETLNVSPSEVMSAAEFDIKQAAVAVSISGLEELQNAGKEQVIDLLESRIENAEQTMQNNIYDGLYSDGTGSGGKQIGGLQLIVADAPTSGTVGGIDRATWSFWQNQVFDATGDGGAATTASNIQTYFNRMYAEVVRGQDRPDLILVDNVYWGFFMASLQNIQRITNEKMGALGFTSVKFMDADVVLDGGNGGGCPASHAYFLNTKYIHYRPHAQRNMVPLSPDRYATNQDAHVKLIGWAGNMTASNCSLQGVLKE